MYIITLGTLGTLGIVIHSNSFQNKKAETGKLSDYWIRFLFYKILSGSTENVLHITTDTQ